MELGDVVFTADTDVDAHMLLSCFHALSLSHSLSLTKTVCVCVCVHVDAYACAQEMTPQVTKGIAEACNLVAYCFITLPTILDLPVLLGTYCSVES